MTAGPPTVSAAASDTTSRDESARRSPRSNRRKVMLALLAGGFALIGLAVSAYYFATRPVTLRIAVGPPAGDDVKVIQTMAQLFTRDHESVRLRTVVTDSVGASATALEQGAVDLAVVRGDLAIPKTARAVAMLRRSVAMLLVPPLKTDLKADTAAPNAGKITDISQLAGRRIGVIGKTEANVKLLDVILRQYGVDPVKVTVLQFALPEVAEAIRSNKADAYLAAGPIGGRLIADTIAAALREAGSPAFLPIESAGAIAQNHPVYETAEIPAGVFGGAPARPQTEIRTISFSHYIVARDTLSDSTAGDLARQIFAVRQDLAADFPLAAKIETPDTDKDATLPAHPGAAAYIDGEELSFLEGYSDYIWWSLMGASALGSLGAWLASYLRRDERTDTVSLRGRLLDMLTQARRSDSVAELDRMESEADDIMRSTLDTFERGGIEEGSLTAFQIALEQFHHAVADRRAVLARRPPQDASGEAVKADVKLIAG